MWGHYLKRAVAALLANRLYSAVGILSLTVGFTVAILVGLFARHEFAYDRWLPDHDRLFIVGQTYLGPAHAPPWYAYPTRTDVAKYLQADFPQVEAVARLAPGSVVLTRGAVSLPEPDFAWADPNIFDLLKLKPIAGDLKTALAAPDGLVLTRSLARKHFGRDAPVGESITLQVLVGGAGAAPEKPGFAIPLTVKAVVEDPPPETHLAVKAWGSALAPPIHAVDQQPAAPFGQIAFTYVRLRPGASASDVQAGLPAFARRHIPPLPQGSGSLAFTLRPLTSLHRPPVHIDMPGNVTPPADPAILRGLIAIGGLVLLTAIVNFVGLATARASRRAVEVGVRKAVGASRRDLVAQFMVEILLQVAIALVLALALSELAAPHVGAFVQRVLTLDYTDPVVMGVVLGAGLLSGVLAGAYPAVVLASFRPVAALKGGAQQAGRTAGVRQGLVIVQFAVLILLTLVVSTVYRQTRLALDEARRFGGDQVLLLAENGLCGGGFEAGVRALPGVQGLSCFANTALRNGGAGTTAMTPDGRPVSVDAGPMDTSFFPLFGIRPAAGRLFSAAYGQDVTLLTPGSQGVPTVMLNTTAARALGFRSPRAAVGHAVRWRRIRWDGTNGPQPGPIMDVAEVVGVVPDFAMGLVRDPVHPMIYWIDPVYFGTVAVKIDATQAPSILAGVDRLWRDAGHVRPMHRRFLGQAVRQAYADVLVLGAVIAVCAGVALIIACVGLFALAAFTTEQRTKEIGIRKALGAGTADLARLLLWQFTKPVLAACLIASPIAWFAMHRWLEGFPERVGQPTWLFAASAATAVAIAWLTVGAHTLIMARARPVTALRYE